MKLAYMLANPQLYDYVHDLDFREDGSVELKDGAGQLINCVVRGRYSVRALGDESAVVAFFELKEVDPHQDYALLGERAGFSVQVTRERGLFPFIEESPSKVNDPDARPALLYQMRYVYTFDPLTFGRGKEISNLYGVVEGRELSESARCYYPRDEVERLTAGELRARGLAP
jgi:hypothetical protein